MRSTLVTVVFVCLTLTTAWCGLIQPHVRSVEGSIVTKNVKTSTVIVKENGTNQQREFVLNANQLAMVDEGNVVFIVHDENSKLVNFLRRIQ